jgi:hypothetical protein
MLAISCTAKYSNHYETVNEQTLTSLTEQQRINLKQTYYSHYFPSGLPS